VALVPATRRWRQVIRPLIVAAAAFLKILTKLFSGRRFGDFLKCGIRLESSTREMLVLLFLLPLEIAPSLKPLQRIQFAHRARVTTAFFQSRRLPRMATAPFDFAFNLHGAGCRRPSR
jgi:hypothetical protein